MRIPLNWLSEYVKLPEKGLLADKLTMAGHMLDKIDKVGAETVIDLELRGNRADCYSIFGIAREVSALFSTPLKSPKVYTKLKKAKDLPQVKLEVKTPLVKRVMMLAIKNVTIEPSPKWLAEKLIAYGIDPINNIVDLSNFVMLETGEPVHTFDLDKVDKNLHIRLARKGEHMLTFLGKRLTLSNQDLVWANDSAVLSVGGAIGGSEHSITNSTKNVLLEAASYDRANIRRTIHRHNLFTDAGIRHEKELDPNLVEDAVGRFAYLIDKYKWGKLAPVVSDYYPDPVGPWKLSLNYNFLNTLSGMFIDPKIVSQILSSLNFKVINETDSDIEVVVPTYRTDVTLEEDLVEEILRIIGYDKIPVQTLSLEIPKTITPSYIKQELELKTISTAHGFNEIISLPFVAEKNQIFNKPLMDIGSEVAVANPPSPDLKILRQSMLPNLLEATERVINERGTYTQFFEVGRTYHQKKSKYTEARKLGLIYWDREKGSFPFFKGQIESILESLRITGTRFEPTDLPNLRKSYEIKLGQKVTGVGGQIDSIFYAEIDLDVILDKGAKIHAKLWSKYPPQIEDITITLPKRTKVGDIIHSIKEVDERVENIELKDIYKDNYTLRIWYQDPNKTLTDAEVEEIRRKIILNLKKYGITSFV